VNAVLYGGDRAAPVLYSWASSLDRLIYGKVNSLPACGDNDIPDSQISLQNHGDYQTQLSSRGKSPIAANAAQYFTRPRARPGAAG
jgi:hypothetical protein